MHGAARSWVLMAKVACVALLPYPALGQQAPIGPTPILSLDQDALFAQSKFGKAALGTYLADQDALAAENRSIEAVLEAEERDLTAKRKTLPADDFAVLAAAFDKKVEGIRAAQTAKPVELKRGLDGARQRFFDVASPVLGQLMLDRGAYVIIDKRAVVLGFDAIDMTPAAIRRIDEVMGSGPLAKPAQNGDALPEVPISPEEPSPTP